MSEIADFLAVVQPQLLPGERIELRAIAPDRSPSQHWATTVCEGERTALALAPAAHIYFGVALRRGGGTANHCTRAGCLWADIDAKLWSDAPDPLSAARVAINRFTLPPSAVVCSGAGYHVYWRLAAPLDLHKPGARVRLESLNAAVARALCGQGRAPDHVQDVARVLRLPGTLNHKTVPPLPVTLDLLAPDRSDSLDAIAAHLSKRYPWAMRAATPAAPRCLPVAPRPPAIDTLSHALRRLSPAMRALLDTPGAGGYQSASEADSAVACALIGAGLTDAETLAVLLGSPRAADHAARKRGHERHELAYWQRTISSAAAHVGPVTVTPTGRRTRRLPLPTRPPSVSLPASARPASVLLEVDR